MVDQKPVSSGGLGPLALQAEADPEADPRARKSGGYPVTPAAGCCPACVLLAPAASGVGHRHLRRNCRSHGATFVGWDYAGLLPGDM